MNKTTTKPGDRYWGQVGATGMDVAAPDSTWKSLILLLMNDRMICNY